MTANDNALETGDKRVRIHLSPAFMEFADGRKNVTVKGRTTRECLGNLIALFPIFKALLFNADNCLIALVICEGNVIVQNKLDDLRTSDRGISLRPMIYGG